MHTWSWKKYAAKSSSTIQSADLPKCKDLNGSQALHSCHFFGTSDNSTIWAFAYKRKRFHYQMDIVYSQLTVVPFIFNCDSWTHLVGLMVICHLVMPDEIFISKKHSKSEGSLLIWFAWADIKSCSDTTWDAIYLSPCDVFWVSHLQVSLLAVCCLWMWQPLKQNIWAAVLMWVRMYIYRINSKPSFYNDDQRKMEQVCNIGAAMGFLLRSNLVCRIVFAPAMKN